MVDETISEKCETLYNKLNTFVESEISRDVTPQISNLNSRINALEPNLVRVKEVNGNASSISAGGTSTKTFTVPACPSGYGWKYLSTSTGWGTVSSVSLSGTTLTVTLLNVSNTSHDISFSGVLMYYPKTIEAEPHIQLVATNPYLLEGEITDLVVSLVDEFGLPLSGKTVTISDGTSSYNGITNNQGIFTLPDISVSSDTTFTATYSLASDSIVIEYCTMVDYGVTNNSNLIQWFYNPSYSSASVDESGITFIAVKEGSYATVSATLTQNPSSTDIYIYSLPLTVEFDLIGWEDNQGATNDYARIRVYNNANNKIAYWDFKDFGAGHYKIVCTEGSQKLYYNSVEQSRMFTFTPLTAWNVAFQTRGNIKFRNFRIREG